MIDPVTFQWLVGILTLLVVGGVAIFLVEAMRLRFRKIGKTKLLLEIRTPIATIERYLVNRQENVLTVRGTDGNPYDYIIDEKSTYNEDYPAGLPLFMQTTIKKAYYDEGISIPNTRKERDGDKDRDARILARAREKAIIDGDSKQLAASSGMPMGGSNMLILVMLAIIILASCASAYFGYTGMNANAEIRNALIGAPK